MASADELANFYGAEAIQPPGPAELAETAEDIYLQMGGNPLQLEDPTARDERTEDDIAAQYGAVEVPVPGESVGPRVDLTAAEEDSRKIRSVLEAEATWLSNYDPQDREGIAKKIRLQRDFEKRWVEQTEQDRQSDLESMITFGGQAMGERFQNQSAWERRWHQLRTEVVGTVQVATMNALGYREQANRRQSALNDFNEYMGLLARDTIVDKNVGNLGVSLGKGTAAFLTLGPAAMATMFAAEDFNKGMEEGAAKGLTPGETWRHATVKGSVTAGTIALGGAIANRFGVSAGDSLTPLYGKTAKELFSKAGLTQALTAGLIEGGEEGVQTGLSLFEDLRAGTNPDAMDNWWGEVGKSAAIGATVGTAVHGVTAFKDTDAAKFEMTVDHTRSLLEGWGKRVQDNPAPVEVETSASEYVETPDGHTISKSDLNKEIHAVDQLSQEIDALYEKGGDAKLKQRLIEREDAYGGTVAEIKDLRTELNKTNVVAEKENLKTRLKIAEKYKFDLGKKMELDRDTQVEWRQKFEEVHKEERQFVEDELTRLAGLKELPDTDFAGKLTKELEERAAKETAAKESAEPKKKGFFGKKDTGPLEDVPSDVEGLLHKTDATTGKSEAVSDFEAAKQKSDHEHVNQVREYMGLDRVPRREQQGLEADIETALRENLADASLDYAKKSLETGEMLSSVQLAGLASRYAKTVDNLVSLHDKMVARDRSGMSEKVAELSFTKDAEVIAEYKQELDTLTEAWIRSSSEAGAALQANQRALGHLFSPERAILYARRLKEKDLTVEEIAELTKVSQDVKVAAEELTKHEPGTEDYLRALYALDTAQLEHQATVANHEPTGHLLSAIESANAFMMTRVLSGDFIPFGRQGFIPMFISPKQSLANTKAFFKPFANLSVEQARYKAFEAEHKLKELPHFKKLKEIYDVPFMNRNTPYSEVEGSSLGRMRMAVNRTFGKKLKKVADATENLRGEQFELGYRAWLNTTRFTMANLAYEANKSLVEGVHLTADQKVDGQREMKMVIDWVMNATGHSKLGGGPVGRAGLIAPRWLMSLFAIPGKAVKHMPRGLMHTLMGKKSASTYISKQYVKVMIGSSALAYMMYGVGVAMFGEENVTLDWDPRSPGAGNLTLNGQVINVAGGSAFVWRNMYKAGQGAYYSVTDSGPEDEKVVNAMFSIGGTLTSRLAPVPRVAAYFAQNQIPIGETEQMAIGEFMLRQSVFLSAQEMYDAARHDGFSHAVAIGILAMNGFGSYVPRKKK